MKTTLVIMAAGLGTRFGAGIKQLTPVGPNGELIIDYSIHDAVEAGFDKVVFIIRKDIEDEFRSAIGDRIEQTLNCDVCYAFQNLTDLPSGHTVPVGRTKPWGTGQAVLAARELLREPFCVINADDYYGKEAFSRIHSFLVQHADTERQYCMCGFALKNTLSKNGSVTRGICQVDESNHLLSVKETYKIIPTDDGVATEDGEQLDPNAHVSMNIWGFTPDYMDCLADGFVEFLDHISDPLKDEYLIPNHVDSLIRSRKCSVEMLESGDKWFGVTYAVDRESVQEEFKKMVEDGVYGKELFSKELRRNTLCAE